MIKLLIFLIEAFLENPKNLTDAKKIKIMEIKLGLGGNFIDIKSQFLQKHHR